EDGIRDRNVTGVQTCALPIYQQFSSEIKTFSLRLPPPSTCGHANRRAGKPSWVGGFCGPTLTMRQGDHRATWATAFEAAPLIKRSEERRVGKGSGSQRGTREW